MSLDQTLQSLPLSNKQLIKAAQILQDICQPPLFFENETQSYDVLLLIDELEAALTHLDKVLINPDKNEHKQRAAIRTAFLYEFANWLDTSS